jgi:hypothetical protein
MVVEKYEIPALLLSKLNFKQNPASFPLNTKPQNIFPKEWP